MACNLTKGFLLDCIEGQGGVSEIFLANYSAFETGVTEDVTSGEIDGLPTATVFRYQPLKNSANFTDNVATSQENGTSFSTQTITFRLGQLSQSKRNELDILRKARVVAFIKLNNLVSGKNQILMFGRRNGLFCTAVNGQSGSALGDFFGYEVTLTGEEVEMADVLEAYTTTPFDNFVDITVDPAYTVVS